MQCDTVTCAPVDLLPVRPAEELQRMPRTRLVKATPLFVGLRTSVRTEMCTFLPTGTAYTFGADIIGAGSHAPSSSFFDGLGLLETGLGDDDDFITDLYIRPEPGPPPAAPRAQRRGGRTALPQLPLPANPVPPQAAGSIPHGSRGTGGARAVPAGPAPRTEPFAPGAVSSAVAAFHPSTMAFIVRPNTQLYALRAL